MVARRGRVVHLDVRGWSDKEAGTRLAEDSLFRLASQTKPVTAAAAMILLEQGRFRLDDPISKYIPEYANMKTVVVGESGEAELVPSDPPITIRHLLTHTSVATLCNAAMVRVWCLGTAWFVSFPGAAIARRVGSTRVGRCWGGGGSGRGFR